MWSNTQILTLKFSMTAAKPTVGSASVDGPQDRQKTGVSCPRFFCRYQDLVEQHEGKIQRKADATAARLDAIQRACGATGPHLCMGLKTNIQKNSCVGAPAQ